MMDVRTLQLKGYKAYLAGFGSILYGVGGAYVGLHGPGEVVAYSVAGLGLIGIRQKMNDLSLPQSVVDKAKG